MGRRQELTKRQALLVIAIMVGAFAFGLAHGAAGPLPAPEFILVLVVLEFAVQPLLTLGHEWGHALVARRVSYGTVIVLVGRGPYMSPLIGGIRINFSLLPGRGVRIRGLCRYDPADVSWRARAAVALAGPLATLLELVATIAVTIALWPGAGSFVRNLLALVIGALALSLVVNLLPDTIVPGLLANDGSTALAALRNHRAGRPLAPLHRTRGAAVQPAPNSSTTTSPAHETSNDRPDAVAVAPMPPLERELDRLRAITSVPPPSTRDALPLRTDSPGSRKRRAEAFRLRPRARAASASVPKQQPSTSHPSDLSCGHSGSDCRHSSLAAPPRLQDSADRAAGSPESRRDGREVRC